jgi:hypothetical protein
LIFWMLELLALLKLLPIDSENCDSCKAKNNKFTVLEAEGAVRPEGSSEPCSNKEGKSDSDQSFIDTIEDGENQLFTVVPWR